VAALLRLAGGIASAAHHLHRRGILHGDLYAHNILHTGAGDALLGDFGAASFSDSDDAHAEALQRLEVRAFGLLLGELMERCDGDDGSREVVTRLVQLQGECVQADAVARPSFGQIVRVFGVFNQGVASKLQSDAD
jgi:serine/threonine protein kinase